MSETKILFYEDTKAQKKYLMSFAILFYVGIGASLVALGIAFLVNGNSVFEQLDMGVTEWLLFPFLTTMAVSFSLYAVKSKRLKYYISINQENFVVNTIQGNSLSLIKYSVSDFEKYEKMQSTNRFAKYQLTFSENRKTMIITRKQAKLEKVLDSLLVTKNETKPR